ncbi:MAG: organomercurial lyase [Gammaproteobacteria bacterium]
METAEAVARLNRQLPQLQRQQTLPAAWVAVHRAVLRSLATRGRPLDEGEIAAMPGIDDARGVIGRLADLDLIVTDTDRVRVLGAYPMTTEPTPHRLRLPACEVFAMCALDAVSVSAMFGLEVDIRSRCHVTGTPIHIRQLGMRIVQAVPSEQVRVGIRWQAPVGFAAHSMCMEMVFLRDPATAAGWRRGGEAHIDLFTLPEAVAFGAAFFVPLLSD